MKIKNKLLLVAVILTVIVIIFSYFTVSTVQKMETTYSVLMEEPIKRLEYAYDAVGQLLTIRRCVMSMNMLPEDDTSIVQFYKDCQEAERIFISCLEGYHKNLMSDSSLKEEYISDIEVIVQSTMNLFIDEYLPKINKLYLKALKDGYEVDEMVEIIGIESGLSKNLNNLQLVSKSEFDNMPKMISSSVVGARNKISGIAACAIALSIIVTALISRAIRFPILKMKSAMKEIENGNLNYPIRSSTKDELGELADSIGDMVDKIAAMNKTMAIIDNVDNMIYVTDLDHNILYVNRKMTEAYGLNSENCISEKCYKFFCHNNNHTAPCSHCVLSELIIASRREHLPSREWDYKWNENLKMWLSGRSSIIKWVDGSFAYINIAKDETPRKQHEEQQKRYEEELRHAVLTAEEASRTKTAFLANMSHEIRTPMNSIVGFAELALDDMDIQPRIKEYLNNIKSSSDGLLQIINDILDISKIEAGKIVLESIPFTLHDVFKICQTIVGAKAAEKGITLYCYAEPSIGKKLIGDPTRLRQSLINLLSNAVKFTNVGFVKLMSSVVKSTENDVMIHFEVKDSGIGMTPEQIGKVFDPFTQADSSTSRKYGGTGLGLAITKNIIELMGGTLNVSSELGIGSKFSFDITFQTISISYADTNDNQIAMSEIKKPTFVGEVLLCEDNIMNQQVIREYLARVGLETVIASNGKEGVSIIQNRMENDEKPFDLIFMDMHMPVMDGLEAADRLIEMGNKTPIVAITANIMSNDREIYRNHNMPECVPKPFTTQELWSCLLKYLTPISIEEDDKSKSRDEDAKLNEQILEDFVKSNQTTFADINAAIDSGDIKLAHRLAHTLKGLAGLIGNASLQEAARVIEFSLADGEPKFTADQMKILEIELNSALDEFAVFLNNAKPHMKPLIKNKIDKENALKLFNELEPMLRKGSPECLKMTDKLREFEGTDTLIEQMEDFDFRLAIATLIYIKQDLEA